MEKRGEAMPLDLLLKLATTVGARVLKEEPMAKAIRLAIDATADEFTQMEGVRDDLRTWCDSDEFSDLFSKLQEGRITPQAGDLVSSFVQTGFFLQDQTDSVAENILDTFAQKLEDELYKSEFGMKILAERPEKTIQPTRSRFAERVTEIYKDFALSLWTGGDSPYHQRTLEDLLKRYETLPKSEIEKVDTACRGLAKDILIRLATIADIAENSLSMLEHLRLSFGYAITSTSAEFEAMIDALQAIIQLSPRRPADSYSDVKSRARIPMAIADLGVFCERGKMFDASFKRLFKVATGRQFEGGVSERSLMDSINWYDQYHTVMKSLWERIAQCSTLPPDTW
jgi:hypothetical protein